MKKLFNEVGLSGAEYRKGQWEEIAVHNEKEIRGFFGPYRFLSNFWPARVILDGVVYGSVEVAFQASKWKPENREYFLTCTNKESIDHNRKNNPNLYTAEGWDAIKIEVMCGLVKQKFDKALNPDNHAKLMETGDKFLEEKNWWGDDFWGVVLSGEGQNNLGKILMEVRSQS